VREVWDRLRGGELTPHRLAWSVAVGLAIGVTPLWGLHWLLVLAVCVPFRLDTPVAYLAANVSLPFIAPFLSFAEIEIGAWVRTGHGFPLDRETLRVQGPRAFAEDLAVGILLFAPGVAAAGGAIAYTIARVAKRRAALPARQVEEKR
jgi:uncharacterized protein (DUF2062 family)